MDIDEIFRRAQEASNRASADLEKSIQKSAEIARQASEETELEKKQNEDAKKAAEQASASSRRQVEILGQLFDEETLAQMASSEAQIQNMVAEQVSEYASMSADGMMEKLFGEDMGILSAALETLALENEQAETDLEEDAESFDLAFEQKLYHILENSMEQIDSLPEPEPVYYTKDSKQWGRFGILLSGIVSKVNEHELDGLDVEEHIPILEQRIVSLVRRSWGINGRAELMETLRYLTQEGYVFRYQQYCEAASPEELCGEEIEEEEIASVSRGWRFAQYYKERYLPDFLLGWDIGRAAMLTRWGYYLGWITEGEAIGILWDLSQKVCLGMRSWREFARSYQFGGIFWKILNGAPDAESYLGYITNAATDLLTGDPEEDGGQWKSCPWPETHKIGFR